MSAHERLIVLILFEGVDLLDITGPPEVFALLERELPTPSGYRVVLAAAGDGPVTTSAGVRVLPDITFAELLSSRIDTVIVPGAVEVDPDRHVRALVDSEIVTWTRRLAECSQRIASVCVGAHVLAAAGLLTGKRATTHWSTADQLAADHPEVEVDADPIYIRDGRVWTGAGLSACIDLALALVADDFGEAAALGVARQLVMYLKRPGGQSQFSVPLGSAPTSRRIDDLRHFVAGNLTRPLSVTDLAGHIHISERQLARIVREELGTTPSAYVERARVERARHRLETSDDTLDRIAADSGLGSVDTLTRAFRRTLRITPTEYRNRFRMTPEHPRRTSAAPRQ